VVEGLERKSMLPCVSEYKYLGAVRGHVKGLGIVGRSGFMFCPQLETMTALCLESSKLFAEKIHQECFINVNEESVCMIPSLMSTEILPRRRRGRGRYGRRFCKE
jgi:hypothetical protein